MPELAEVEYLRKRWNPGIGEKISHVSLRHAARVLRGVDTAKLAHALIGATLESSEAAAKQMVFRFSGEVWLGIHLGMTGELKCVDVPYSSEKHDHLVLFTAKHALVFEDPRMFGRVQFSQGAESPAWWSSIAPAISSEKFTVASVADFLRRRKKTVIKAVLLMQEKFPGIGNWMADEILWRAEIHPQRLAGSLNDEEIKALHRETRWVAREALRIVGKDFDDLPQSWLFPHRWQTGGTCPKTGVPLERAEIGGRTTCWSPGRQIMPGEKRRVPAKRAVSGKPSISTKRAASIKSRSSEKKSAEGKSLSSAKKISANATSEHSAHPAHAKKSTRSRLQRTIGPHAPHGRR